MSADWDVIAKTHGFESEEEMFRTLYIRKGFSITRLARKLKLSTTAINHRMELLGIEKRSRGGANFVPAQKRRLHLADQRVVFLSSVELVARQLFVHPSAVVQYRNR